MLAACTDLETSCALLIDTAKHNRSRDNITVVLFRVDAAGADGLPGEDETIAGQVSAADVRAAAALDEPTEPHPGPTAGC